MFSRLIDLKVGILQGCSNGLVARRGRGPLAKAVARTVLESLEQRMLLAGDIITSLVDPFTDGVIDTALWTVTDRGLENNAPAGYNEPFEDAGGLTLGGTVTNQY